MIDITRTDLLSSGELLGGGNSEKIEKMRFFNLRRSDRILMTFDIWKNIVSQSSYFKSRPDQVTLGEVGGGSLKSWKTLIVQGSG